MPDFEHNKTLRDSVEQRIEQFNRIQQPNKSLTRAAVVLGISSSSNTGSACLLLTRRSSKLRKHAGQYALPGGKVDAGETLIEAALRELSEELHLSPKRENVVGELDDIVTHSGFCITPIVVWIDDHNDLVANPDEVAAVYEIPLRELASVELGLSKEDADTAVTAGADSDIEISSSAEHDGNQSVMSIYLPSVGTTIYSPTAAIIYQFKEVALCARSTRVAHFGQPRFAWK